VGGIFSIVSQRHLPKLLSNHFLLMLDCGVGSRGSRYFKFGNMLMQLEGFVEQVKPWWGSRGSRYFKFGNMLMQLEGFVEQVKPWWGSYNYQGVPCYVLAQKMIALKFDL
jgi:hypothetical protein